MSQSELVPLLGEIRDQLKRIANILEDVTSDRSLNVELGEPTVAIRNIRNHKGDLVPLQVRD